MNRFSVTKQVHHIHFDDFSGEQFERLVFAYYTRTENWRSLEWYGQVGSDLGRDIWGVTEDGSTVCIQCANRKKITHKKATDAIDAILKASRGKPDRFRFVCACPVSAKARDKIKEYATAKGILFCDIWSGPEFEENLRAKCESLLQRFFNGEEFPDSPEELSQFVASPANGSNTRASGVDVYQELATLWWAFKEGLWYDELRDKAVTNLREWLTNNNLRINPKLREKIRLCLCDVGRFPGWKARNEHEAAEYQQTIIEIYYDIQQASDLLNAPPPRPREPRFAVAARISQADQRQGLSFIITLVLTNEGEGTARGLRVTVEYGETHCLDFRHDDKTWEQISFGMSIPSNPRNLRARHDLNPKNHLPIFSIPTCERTVFPLRITVTISAEDQEPVTVSGAIASPEANQTIQFLPPK